MTPATAPTIAEVDAAAQRLRGVVLRTPLVPLHTYPSEETGGDDILLKVEVHQAVNSFKIRGVFHAVALLPDERRRMGVSTVSAGNTAQALAWAARHFCVAARSVMPEGAPEAKIAAVEAYGGTPVLVPMDEVFRYLREHLWEQEPHAFIHPWINRDVMIGHGTLAREIIEDCPDVASVFIPVGGGGLMGGLGSAIKAIKPDVRVIAVEPHGCPSFHHSLEAGRPVSVHCQSICDGVAVPYMTEEMFPLLAEVADDAVLVTEADVKSTVRRLALRNKIVAEPSGALAAAAALAMPSSHRGRSACLVTGGSIDAKKLITLLSEDG